MDARNFWELFLETGAPELYLMYREKMLEEKHVSDDPGTGAAGYRLQ